MDDSAQNPAPQVSGNPTDNTQQVIEPVAVQQPPAQPISQPPPAMPVGSIHKEAGPMRSSEAPVVEVLTPTEQAPQLSEEVAEAGVEVSKNPEVPDLTIHDKKAGLEHAPVIAPVPTQPSGAVQLPITKQQAMETLKHKNTKSSLTWLSELVLRITGKVKGEA